MAATLSLRPVCLAMNAPDLEALPAVVAVLVASKVLGIGKNQTYDLIR